MGKLALLLLSLAGAIGVGGIGLGLASATTLTSASELMVSCLACGEQWAYIPAITLAQACGTLLRRRRLKDECPKCRSHEVVFGHPHHSRGPSTS